MRIVETLFLRHPREQDESYWEHGRFAAGVGARMMLGGAACLVHALVPSLFTSTGSRTLRELSARLAARGAGARAAGSRDPDGRPAPARV